MEHDLAPVDICHAALMDVGRPDLAELVQFSVNDDGSEYLEPLDEVDDEDDWALMLRAEAIALSGRYQRDIAAPASGADRTGKAPS